MIDIITWNRYFIFWKDLQNFALQEVFKIHDYEVEIEIDNLSFVKKIIKVLKNPFIILKKISNIRCANNVKYLD